jgi:hypothetical protein
MNWGGTPVLLLESVRQQLKSVFNKTAVSRQAELVSILVGSALRSPRNIEAGDGDI